MNRQNTILAGVLAIVVILGAGVFFGVLPQNRAADEAKTAESKLVQTNNLLNIQLASLRKQKDDMAGLDRQLADLRQQIPATANLAGVTRVIVNALRPLHGNKGATLVSITPQVPPIEFTPREQLTADIGTPEAVEPAPSGGVVAEPLPPGTFQQVPLAIEATAPDVRSAFQFVDLLNAGPRLLAIHHVDIQTSQNAQDADPITISVIGAAFLQPKADATTATKKPATTSGG